MRPFKVYDWPGVFSVVTNKGSAGLKENSGPSWVTRSLACAGGLLPV
jgi:hypothetical protein